MLDVTTTYGHLSSATATVLRSCCVDRRQRGDTLRVGFTLIELLVVIVILLIVTTMTVVMVNFSFDAERTRSASRQVQSFLEGARNRAIYAKKPRGVRFVADQTNGRTVTSMVYIGPNDPWTQGTIRLERPDFDPNKDGFPDDEVVDIVHGANTDWFRLKQKGLLIDGMRIKIPRGQDGNWYTVLTNRLTDDDNQYLVLSIAYRDPGSTETSQINAFEGGGPSTYLLELLPSELPNEETSLLPRGIVIDLDGSKVPDAWRPPPGSVLSAVYSSSMDVLFSPRGTVTGAAASSGLIHFYLAEAVAVDNAATHLAGAGLRPINQGGSRRYVVPAEELGPPGSREPVGERLVVTLFTRTGNISTHPVDPRDGEGDDVASDPFFFAETGEEAGE